MIRPRESGKVLDYLNVKGETQDPAFSLFKYKHAFLFSWRYCMCFLHCVMLYPFGLNFSKHTSKNVIMMILICCRLRIATICIFFFCGGKYLKEQIIYCSKLTYITNFICYFQLQIVHWY